MRFHLNMSATPYSVPSNSGLEKTMQIDSHMNSTCSLAPSVSAAYDMVPYSAVSSFSSITSSADSILLTPTSSSGSPSSSQQYRQQSTQQPQQQQQQPPSLLHQQHQQHSAYPQQLVQSPAGSVNTNTANTLDKAGKPSSLFALASSSPSSVSQPLHVQHQQQLTPPSSSRMLYPYAATAPAHADPHSSASSFDLGNYIHSGIKTEATAGSGPGPGTGAGSGTSPIEPYFTSYTVSTAPEGTASTTSMDYPFSTAGGFYQQRLPQPHQPYGSASSALQQHSQASALHQHHQHHLHQHPQHQQHQQHQQSQPQQPQPQHGRAPILAQPAPSHYRPSNIQNYRDPTLLNSPGSSDQKSYTLLSNAPGVLPRDRRRSSGGSRHNASSSVAPSATTSSIADERTPRSDTTDMRSLFQSRGDAESENTLAIAPDAAAMATTKTPYITLSDKASEEEKYLYHLHQQYKNVRGKGMWDAISHKFTEKFPGTSGTARLQMMFTRAFRKYVLWPEAELELLLQAYREDELQRYSRVTALLKEKGGGKVWDWKPVDIEMMLVRLRLEEPLYDETSKLRRRKQSALRRRSMATGVSQQQQQQQQSTDHMMVAPSWTAGYGAAGMAHHPQFSLPQLHQQQQHSSAGYETMTDASTLQSEAYTSDQEADILDQMERKYGGGLDDANSSSRTVV